MSVSESNISDAVVGHEAILWFLTHGGQEPVQNHTPKTERY